MARSLSLRHPSAWPAQQRGAGAWLAGDCLLVSEQEATGAAFLKEGLAVPLPKPALHKTSKQAGGASAFKQQWCSSNAFLAKGPEKRGLRNVCRH